MQQHLKLVVLNGCANREQVKMLFENGVKAVIATQAPIQDQKAILFSTAFYDALRSSKAIRESFDQAAARMREDYPELDVAFRGLGFKKGHEFPWGLYARDNADLNWKIPDPYRAPENLDYFTEVELANPNANKAFIELVFESMTRLNNKCRLLWEDYQNPNSEDTNTYDLQEAIYNHFPSILSIHIRDLFTENARRKGRLRLKVFSEAYSALGKLLSSIALASLWQAAMDELALRPREGFYIRPEYKEDLSGYLKQTSGESNSYDYIWLLSAIGRIFADNDIDPFIEELKGLDQTLSEDAELYSTYHFLEFELKRRLLANNIASREVPDFCEEAERHFGLLLSRCAFLITYQLVSVNDISVRKALWVPEADFVHNKVLLRGVEETIRDRDPLLRKTFTSNHAVIVAKNFRSDEEPLILSPFLIDENAHKLKRKEQSKIHFFAGRTEEGKPWYQHAEVMQEGFALPPEEKNIYRIENLEYIVKLQCRRAGTIFPVPSGDAGYPPELQNHPGDARGVHRPPLGLRIPGTHLVRQPLPHQATARAKLLAEDPEGIAAAVLEKLATGRTGVELTYLQVFLDRLYRRASSEGGSPPTFSTAAIEQMGTIEDVIDEFLDEQLAALETELGPGRKGIPLKILGAMVSDERTKKVLHLEDMEAIRLRHGLTEAEMKTCLQAFERMRILNRYES